MTDLPHHRHEALRQRLRQGDALVAQTLAEEFDVSLDTIRRDIIMLEQQGTAQRVRGGAIAAVIPAVALQYRAPSATPAQDRIAVRALRHLEPYSTLLLDGGATVLALAERLQPRPGLLVMTPSPWVAVACQKNGVDVFLLGGNLSPRGGVATGPGTLEMARDIFADVAVLGVCGLDAAFGLSADDRQEAHLKAAMAQASQRTLVLAARDKLAKRARHRAVTVEALDTLVTDATEAETRAFDAAGMEILHVTP